MPSTTNQSAPKQKHRHNPKADTLKKHDHVSKQWGPLLVAYEDIVIDAKVIERITDRERGQILNYLKVTGAKVGVIINFQKPALEWERLVL